jgi:CBS domain containing-hemolysin-like protein
MTVLQTVVEIMPTTLCKNRAEKSALILHPATRNFLDFIRNYHFS